MKDNYYGLNSATEKHYLTFSDDFSFGQGDLPPERSKISCSLYILPEIKTLPER